MLQTGDIPVNVYLMGIILHLLLSIYIINIAAQGYRNITGVLLF